MGILSTQSRIPETFIVWDLLGAAATGTTFAGDASGNNTLSFARMTHGVVVNLATDGGHDYGVAWSNVQNLIASSDDDVLTLGAGGGVITAGAGADVLTGGANGANTFIAGPGTAIFDGVGGNNTVSYANSTAAVDVNLGAGVSHGGYANGDRFNDIQNLIGSNYDDMLEGGPTTRIPPAHMIRVAVPIGAPAGEPPCKTSAGSTPYRCARGRCSPRRAGSGRRHAAFRTQPSGIHSRPATRETSRWTRSESGDRLAERQSVVGAPADGRGLGLFFEALRGEPKRNRPARPRVASSQTGNLCCVDDLPNFGTDARSPLVGVRVPTNVSDGFGGVDRGGKLKANWLCLSSLTSTSRRGRVAERGAA